MSREHQVGLGGDLSSFKWNHHTSCSACVRVSESDSESKSDSERDDLRSDVDASSPMTGLDRNLESKLMAFSLFC